MINLWTCHLIINRNHSDDCRRDGDSMNANFFPVGHVLLLDF